MTTRWARVARGTLAACFAVFVAALFHAAMGGGVPSVLAITLSLAFAIPACVLLTRRRKTRSGLLRRALAVSLSQFALHALFSLQPGGAQFSRAGFGATDGSAHLHAGSHLAMTGEASANGMAGMHETPLMWLGHASAVVLTVVAMRYGERTLRALLATAAIGIVAIVERITLVPVRATAAMKRAVDAHPVILPAPRVLIGRMRHRGPPAGAFNYAAPFNCA
jgi:O-antigen ligase